MANKPTYEELEKRVEELEDEVIAWKNSEGILRESEERFRNLYNACPKGIFIYKLEPDGVLRMKDANQAAKDILGVDCHPFIDKTIDEAFPSLANTEVPARYRDAAAEGKMWETEQIDYSDGNVNGAFKVVAFQTKQDEMACIFEDNTERKHMEEDLNAQLEFSKVLMDTIPAPVFYKDVEEALRESEDKLRIIFENVNDEIVYLDPQGNVLDVNKSVEKIFGYKPEEVIGKHVSELKFCRPEHMNNITELFSEALAGDLKRLIEFEGLRKDGTKVHIEASSSIIKKDGEIKNILAVIRDISERKQAEEEKKKLETQLRQSQKMEAIGTLAGGIAHEFNNILGIIVGNAELAMDGVPEWDTARFNLKEIRTACLRARDVVKQILAFSHQTTQELMAVDLVQVVNESLNLIRSSIPTSIKIRKNIDSKTYPVLADPTQINQVLINLCTNAARAMRDEGGVLEAGLEDITLGNDNMNPYQDLCPGNYVKMTITDTGCGISADIIDRIFDPYFTTQEVSEGTGMGLAVVHGIVKNHGGDITVRSQLGRGTTFYVLFPVVEDEIQPEVESKESFLKGNERILYVDDEESLVYASKYNLEELGYGVVAERDPIKALDIFKQTPQAFDLVITDMSMPDMTGDKLAKEIMEIRPDISIILCTGYSDLISEEQTRQLGIGAYVMKPYLVHEIAETIRHVLDRKKEKSSVAQRILVVDDEAQMRSMLRELLEIEGYDVSEAPDGNAALWILKEKSADLIITDLIMPEKEGIETIMEIKKDLPNVKIIAISGGGQGDPDQYLDIAKMIGADSTLAKPFRRESLLKSVKKLLN